MKTQKLAVIAAILLITQTAFAADASYQSTTQITGGTLVDTLKQVSFLSHSIKDMLAPTSTITMVHGNQKAVVQKDSTEITDLDKECIIRIDNVKKTYTVTTFADMRAEQLKLFSAEDELIKRAKLQSVRADQLSAQIAERRRAIFTHAFSGASPPVAACVRKVCEVARLTCVMNADAGAEKA